MQIFLIAFIVFVSLLTQILCIDYVKPGDLVYIVTPSSALDAAQKDQVQNTMAFLENEWGLRTKLGKFAFSSHTGFGGTDEERFADLHEAVTDPDVKVILSTRGGYGACHIIDEATYLYSTYPNNSPTKWLIGYSDITHHLAAIDSLNNSMKGVHGTMAAVSTFYNNQFAANALKNILFGETIGTYSVTNTPQLKKGNTTAPIVGGNLSILSHTIGTVNEIVTDGKILFIEDIGEQMRKIDSMIRLLQRSGKLSNIKGLVLGAFTNCPGDQYFKDDVPTLVQGILSDMDLDIPIANNFDIGHQYKNNPIPIGSKATLTVLDKEATLTFGKA